MSPSLLGPVHDALRALCLSVVHCHPQPYVTAAIDVVRES